MSEGTICVGDLIASRRNTSPKRLVEPGPTSDELNLLLRAAATAPDHGGLTPWRFIHVLSDGRASLGEAFRQALLERDPTATERHQLDAVEKAFRAPCLLLAVLDLSVGDNPFPIVERTISLGCAIQNMLLLATAMGFGSGLSSGQAMASTALRSAFELTALEQAICFVSFGRVAKQRNRRTLPSVQDILTQFSSASRSRACEASSTTQPE